MFAHGYKSYEGFTRLMHLPSVTKYLLKYLGKLEFAVANDAPFEESIESTDFMIFSHDLGADKLGYNTIGRELASNGMVVLFLDHLDGSANFALDKNGKEYMFVQNGSNIPPRIV